MQTQQNENVEKASLKILLDLLRKDCVRVKEFYRPRDSFLLLCTDAEDAIKVVINARRSGQTLYWHIKGRLGGGKLLTIINPVANAAIQINVPEGELGEV